MIVCKILTFQDHFKVQKVKTFSVLHEQVAMHTCTLTRTRTGQVSSVHSKISRVRVQVCIAICSWNTLNVLTFYTLNGLEKYEIYIQSNSRHHIPRFLQFIVKFLLNAELCMHKRNVR